MSAHIFGSQSKSIIPREDGMEMLTNEYFRVDLQDRLPVSELKRREAIKERLELQFNLWETEEQHRWLAIPRPDTVSFLGLDWSSILPSVRNYFGDGSVAFYLLSELQLCTVRATVVKAFQVQYKFPEAWLYKQYRQYAIRIQDFGDQIKQYNIPLIDATVTLGQNLNNPAFEDSDPDMLTRLLPQPTSSFRLILFPQTRYSFIEDEIFHGLYPLPEEQVKRMAHSLQRFQGNNGYYNVLPSPFTDSFTPKSFDGQGLREFRYLAAMYPVIEFEFVADYEKRKRSERFITSMQHQKSKVFPAISQWRYSRTFDFTEESRLLAELSQDDIRPERIQSARALFEYACGDHNTLDLDFRQTLVLEAIESRVPNGKSLLVIDPLWILVFPKSNTICAFRNQRMDDLFKGIWGESIDHTDWGQVLIQLVNKTDKNMGSYEPIYRKRLSKLEYQIHTGNDHNLVKSYNLVKSLSDFVAELTILLDPLQAQINFLQHWQQLQRTDWPAKSPLTHSLFDDAINSREVHLNSLKRLQERARELQVLLFQLHSTETAYRQSELALEMAKETKVQRKIAVRNEDHNKALLIFTIITVIFLPLSFFTSYFGMNTNDIRMMDGGQGLFWSVSGPISILIIVISCFFAFHGRMADTFPRLSFHAQKNLASTMEKASLE